MAGTRRQWGWHALRPVWAERLVAAAALPPGALVLDIGAGDGALTRPLLAARARVVAVEAHPERAAGLRRRFRDDDVVVVQADARDLRLPRRPFYVVSNPPYGATSDILRRLLANGTRLQAAHLVLQEQAALRWAGPSAPGAGRWRRELHASVGDRIPRSAFDPPPRVPSRSFVVTRR